MAYIQDCIYEKPSSFVQAAYLTQFSCIDNTTQADKSVSHIERPTPHKYQNKTPHRMACLYNLYFFEYCSYNDNG